MKTLLVLLAIGVCELPLMADDVPTNTPAKSYFYTEGGNNDPFVHFVAAMWSFKDALDRYEKGMPYASDDKREHALNEVRAVAESLRQGEAPFVKFFVESHLPPDALAVSKPLYESLLGKDGVQEREEVIPQYGHADIDQLQRLYHLYAKLPFPKDRDFSRYIHAWNAPSDEPARVSW